MLQSGAQFLFFGRLLRTGRAQMHKLCGGVLCLHLALLCALLHLLQLVPQVVFFCGISGQLALDRLHFVVMALLHRRHLLAHLYFEGLELQPHVFRHAVPLAGTLLGFTVALSIPFCSLTLPLLFPGSAVSCLLRCHPLGDQFFYQAKCPGGQGVDRVRHAYHVQVCLRGGGHCGLSGGRCACKGGGVVW